MCDDDWVSAAMTDNSVVVELLLRLHHASPPPAKTETNPPFPLEWSVRQRRSKPMLLANKKPTPRASPTTPLSWSGATSVSGSPITDGFEESSRPPHTRKESRSKVTTTTGTPSSKRSRKKKTLPELKEEELSLLKERKHLKKELATLLVALEKQRARNESLKSLKLDLESEAAMGGFTKVACVEAVTDQMVQNIVSPKLIPSIVRPDLKIHDYSSDGIMLQSQPSAPKSSSELQKEVIREESNCTLPDLNLPLEENPISGFLL
ncbi:hypothetical protein NMG60_11002761 [Bertholletia excelsa]